MEDRLDEIRSEIAVLKENVEESKLAVSKLEGRKDEILDTIKERFGTSNLVSAEKKLTALGKKRVGFQTKVQSLYEKVRKAMEELESNE